MGVEGSIALRAQGQIVEEIVPTVEERGNSFGGEELGLGLALDQKLLHSQKLAQAEVGEAKERGPEEHELGGETRPPEPSLSHGLAAHPAVAVTVFAFDGRKA